MTSRFCLALLMMVQISAAMAQTYNPSAPAGPASILPAIPPQAAPHMAPIPPLVGQGPSTSQSVVPPNIGLGSPARETSNDRAIRCSGQAAILGPAAGEPGQYTRSCINSP